MKRIIFLATSLFSITADAMQSCPSGNCGTPQTSCPKPHVVAALQQKAQQLSSTRSVPQMSQTAAALYAKYNSQKR